MDDITNNDQVQDGTPTEQATAEQSGTTSEQPVTESKLYKLPDGREMSADDLYKEHTEKLLPEFTRRSQKLSEYERKIAEAETRAGEMTSKALDDDELLKDVDPNVRAVLEGITKQTLTKLLQEQEAQRAKEAESQKFDARLTAAAEKHNGSDGLPKWNRDEMVKFMMEKEIYDPEEAYYARHRERIEEDIIKKALQGKNTDISTEDTGGNAPRKPQTPTPRNFEEAAKSALQRLSLK